MKKNISSLKRLIALALVLITLVGIGTASLHVEAAAATTVKISVSTVKVNTSNLYMAAKDNVKLRKGTGALAGTYATLKKNAIIEVSGTSGSHYKVKLDGVTYYVKKTDLTKAASHRYASLLYTKEKAALRKAPDQNASKTTLSKGRVLLCLGEVKHSGNTWYVCKEKADGPIRFIYSGNVKKASKITLSIEGDTSSMMVADTTKLTYKVDPGIGVVWSSSNSKVATVNIAGKVTGVGDGTAEIKASIPGVIEVAYKIKVTSYETQIKNTHNAIKKLTGRSRFNGLCGLYAGSAVKSLGITKEDNLQNGNDQYNVYKNMSKTSGGYNVKTYSDKSYNLKSALNAVSNNGKSNVKNLLVCFHTGSGSEGQKYGHVVFVHAIVNGKVYFSESYSGKIAGKSFGEGSPIVVTISQFAAYYSSWAKFEGVVHFYK